VTDFDPTSALTDAEKAQIAEQRVRAWAADAYGHQLNKAGVLAADPDADTSDIDTALEHITKAMEATLESVKDVDTEGFESLSKASAALTASREVKPVKPGKGDEIQAAREAVE